MVNEHMGTAKFLEKGMPYKYTNIGKRRVSTTIFSKQVRGTSNTTTSMLSRILFTFLDDDAEETDDEEEDDNLILSSPTIVSGLEGRVLT